MGPVLQPLQGCLFFGCSLPPFTLPFRPHPFAYHAEIELRIDTLTAEQVQYLASWDAGT